MNNKLIKRIISDVSEWQRTANAELVVETDEEVSEWQKSQLNAYLEENNELDNSENNAELIDAIADNLWTLANFFVFSESSIELLFRLARYDSYNYDDLSDLVRSEFNTSSMSSFVAASIMTDIIEDPSNYNKFNLDKAWDIVSKSNWAKFTKDIDVAKATADYYCNTMLVNCRYEKSGEYYIVRCLGDQTIGGKFYFDNKILKCGSWVNGEYVKWQEPDWSDAIL